MLPATCPVKRAICQFLFSNNSIVLSLKMPPQTAQQQLLEKLALSLYAEGYLSFGKARKLCKLSKWEFAEQLGKRGIFRHYTEDDLDEDLAFADENI